MRLMELFDRVADYRLEYEGGLLVGDFKVGDVAYRVYMSAENARGEFKRAVDEASTVGMQDSEIVDVFTDALNQTDYDDTVMYLEFQTEEGITDVTGTGNEFVVFSTVLHIIKTGLKAYQPEWIIFSAKEANRAQLYNRMLRKFTSPNNIWYYPSFDFDTNFLVRVK